ncbi:hypothetical protein PtA15_6A72 [Puccinia triticina]|uniref:Retrograde transport protein Dsl1 C-terminal domain-containing protein n=1 Tax=Puccinia triticina TaxID=208348 RepID=A0ABY7CJZ0_9BASI|nr:uncharacterized protein PtA15_6A72 [Puccinia triticina]WAQ85444.1 hypothetical protein PtA15_6A72 [Puccinia triticina]
MVHRFDPETTQTVDVVVDALHSLACKLTRTYSNKAAEYSQGGISPEESARRKTALVEISTNLLPCLRQQLTDLLASLDIADLERVPNPRLLATLHILKKAGVTLDQISHATRSVTLSPPPAPSRFEDHDCGILKSYRSALLKSAISELIDTHLCSLFNQTVLFLEHWKSANNPGLSADPPPAEHDAIEQRKKIISLIALSNKSIEHLIAWLQLGNDSEVLRYIYKPQIGQLNSNLAELTQRIGLPLPPITNPKIKTTPLNPNPIKLKEAVVFDSDYSESNTSSGQSEDMPVRRATVELAKESLPMIKLIRIFFNKILRTRSNKAPFVLDERISSGELQALMDRLLTLIETLNEFVSILLSIYDEDDLGEEEFDRLWRKSSSLPDAVDTSLLHLAFHLVPVDDQHLTAQDPLAPNPFNTCFFELRERLGCLIAEQFESLLGRCLLIDHDQMHKRAARSLTADQIDVGTNLLAELQTSFLPSLRQQLAGILASLDLGALEKDPRPKFTDTQEIAGQLDNTLSQISTSINSLAPLIPHQSLYSRDRHYGIMKGFRSRHILNQIVGLMSRELRLLFDHHALFIRCWTFSDDNRPTIDGEESYALTLKNKLTELTALSYQAIDNISRWCQRSDFDLLQDTWIAQVNYLSGNLTRLTRRINLTVHWNHEERSLIAGEPSGSGPAGTPDNNTGENQADGDNGSQGSVSSHDEHGLPRDGTPGGSSLNTPFTPYQLELAQRMIPIIKLGRIFFNKLISTGKSKPPFTLGSGMNSADIECLQEEMLQTSNGIAEILSLFHNTDSDMSHGLRWLQELSGHFDSSLLLLGFYLMPITSRLDPPPQENCFKTWFFELRFQFRVALNNLRRSIYGMRLD